MTVSPSRFRVASTEDVEDVLRLMALYYAEDGYPFSEPQARLQLDRFLPDPRLGRIWVAVVSGQLAGYLVVTFGFSFEYGGRDAFIDELYIDEAFRGIGLGREAVRLAKVYCHERGVRALHLEVEPHRTRAAAIYEAEGFAATGRRLMSRRLSPGPGSGGTESVSLYRSQLAQTHHAHFGDLARAAAAHLSDLLGHQGLRSGTIVELACGGGLSSRILTDAGYDVIGVDISGAMIDIARTHTPRARFEHASLWDYVLPPVIAVTAIGEAFCYHTTAHHPDHSGLEGRLRSIFQALSSGGILMFDVATPGRSGATGERRRSWNSQGTFVYLDEREDCEEGILTRTIDNFRPVDSLHHHDRECHVLTLFDADATETSLRRVGFLSQRMTRLGSFDLLPGWVAFVAIKP